VPERAQRRQRSACGVALASALSDAIAGKRSITQPSNCSLLSVGCARRSATARV
jgi:hypothetical protein